MNAFKTFLLIAAQPLFTLGSVGQIEDRGKKGNIEDIERKKRWGGGRFVALGATNLFGCQIKQDASNYFKFIAHGPNRKR